MSTIFLNNSLNTAGVDVLTVLPNQKAEINGVMTELDPKLAVSARKVINTSDGEIWGTNEIKLQAKGWYVSGVKLFKITYGDGIILDDEDITSPDHRLMVNEYKNFLGGIKEEDKTAESGKSTITLMSRLRSDKKLAPPTIEDDGWYVDTDLWYHLMRNYAKKKNTLLIGESGAGKTDLVQILMNKIKKNLSIFDMAITNPTKVLCGNLRADNGTTYYQYSRFAQRIQKEGMVLLDEISRAHPTANNILLPVTDKRRTLYIEDAIDDTEIELHPKCAVWATANIGAKFIGTNSLDHALLNRFSQVAVHYPPKDKESLILQKVQNLSKYQADALTDVVDMIRKDDSLSKDVSTRQLMEIGEMIFDGYTPMQAFELAILQQFDDDNGMGERAKVKSYIQSLRA